MRLPAPGSPLATTTQLRPADRLMLWAMRTWVIALKQRVDADVPLRAGFGRFEVAEAAGLLDALMCIIACGATRTLAVECVCNPAVSADESRILAAIALHQRNRGFEATFILREIVGSPAITHAADTIARLAAMLSAASQLLSEWPLDVEQFAFVVGEQRLTPAPTIH